MKYYLIIIRKNTGVRHVRIKDVSQTSAEAQAIKRCRASQSDVLYASCVGQSL